jgi:hypothetical protein
MAIYSNLNIDQGTSFNVQVTLEDADGGAFNLTGYTVSAQIRRTYASLTSVAFEASVENANTGIISLALSNTVTNAMKAGRYVYDVEVVSPGGAVSRVLEGQVEIFAGVTR